MIDKETLANKASAERFLFLRMLKGITATVLADFDQYLSRLPDDSDQFDLPSILGMRETIQQRIEDRLLVTAQELVFLTMLEVGDDRIPDIEGIEKLIDYVADDTLELFATLETEEIDDPEILIHPNNILSGCDHLREDLVCTEASTYKWNYLKDDCKENTAKAFSGIVTDEEPWDIRK
jgi:hypothetical protein